MKPIKKFSSIKSEEQKILESIKTNYGEMALEIAKKLGYSNLDEIAKEKKLLTKLESLLKDLPDSKNLSEDDAEDIEDKIIKKGEPKSIEDKAGQMEEDGEPGGLSDEVSEDDDSEEEIENEDDDSEDDDSEDDDNDDSEEIENEETETPNPTRRIKTFEDFIQEDTAEDIENELIKQGEPKSIQRKTGEKEEDGETGNVDENKSKEDKIEHDKDAAEDDYVHIADLKKDAAEDKEEEEELEERSSYVRFFSSFIKESEMAGSAGKSVPLEKGDGSETAAGIAGDTMEMGKPKAEDEKDAERVITKDQKITKAAETSPSDDDAGKHINKEVNEGGYSSWYEGRQVMAPNYANSPLHAKAKELFGKDHYNKLSTKQKKEVLETFPPINESQVTEAEVSSDEEFAEYATTVLQKAFGEDFDEAKAQEVIDGLISKYSGDYGAMVGALQSSLG